MQVQLSVKKETTRRVFVGIKSDKMAKTEELHWRDTNVATESVRKPGDLGSFWQNLEVKIGVQ